MNNKEYIAALAGKLGYPQEQTQKMAKTLIEGMGHHFENGESVVVNGFGTFEVRKRLERVIINPASGQRMLGSSQTRTGIQTVFHHQGSI